MAIDGDSTIPEVVDFSADLPPKPFWLRYLVVLFLFVLTCRVVRALDLSNRVHNLLIFLCSVLTNSGRKRRAERKRLAADLRKMRDELKTINMIQQFAAYSKLERRIKSTTRQIEQLAPETFDKSVKRFLAIKLLLFACEGILTGWLLSRSPSVTLTKLELDDAQLRDSYLVPLLKLLYYLPTKLAVIIWICLCHWFCTPIVKWICSRKPVVLVPPAEDSDRMFGNRNG